MIYQGGKTRIARHILSVIGNYVGTELPWIEPFVGGGGMIAKVTGRKAKVGADINKHAINALRVIRDRASELPKSQVEFGLSDYVNLKNGADSWLRDFAGFAYSFQGMWFAGFRVDKSGKRDFVAEAYRAAVTQSKGLQGTRLLCLDYKQLAIDTPSVIYCDPPYAETAAYAGCPQFESDAFWEWCRERACEGHFVFVSEYEAPNDFDCVWEREVVSTLKGPSVGSKRRRKIERLFTKSY